jgi:hypothetical protein
MNSVQINDQRALSLVLYKKLTKDLTAFEEDMTQKAARKLITDAINLLPGYSAENTDRLNVILIRKTDDQSDGVSVNIQDAIDSLMIIWEDYLHLSSYSIKKDKHK